ncbi:DUF2510 domain-containing protein [Streptomyces naganishii]|nr:DUF2510 domain-containing protein [Streptomyces naganishii]
MTQVTPPGWYPDPGQTSDGPATERWWDGKAWTDRTRPLGSPAAWGPPAQPSAGETGLQDQPGSAGQFGSPGQFGVPGQPGSQAQPGFPGQPEIPGQPGIAAQPGYYGHPGWPGYPAPPPAAPRRGLRTGIAVAVAAAVLASIGAGVYALAGDGSGSRDRAGSQGPAGRGGSGGQEGSGGLGGPFGGGPGGNGGSGGNGGPGGSGGSGGSGGPGGSGGQSAAPKIRSGSVTDQVSGISLPIPGGWYGQQLTAGAQVTSDDSYKCPGDTSQECTKGGAYSAPALLLGTQGGTAEEVAKADIAANAKESYGGKTYGGITSHQVLQSKAVTVAGQEGYLVRWKAVTGKGADGYVESLAFPSPADSRRIVVVRFGVDVGQRQSVIDDITKGIKVSSGGGDGQNV